MLNFIVLLNCESNVDVGNKINDNMRMIIKIFFKFILMKNKYYNIIITYSFNLNTLKQINLYFIDILQIFNAISNFSLHLEVKMFSSILILIL